MAATKKVSDNLLIYEAHREPPKEAVKPIQAGRLKGMSDINPMWRIKALTEEFGPCGVGWYYTVDKQWLEPCGNETVAFVNISLFVKQGDTWSMPIFGNGGSKLIAQERNGAYVSDDAYKMSVTDALGQACKQLGIAADVYWNSDRTKYSTGASEANKSTPKQEPTEQKEITEPVNTSEEVDVRLIPTKNNKMTKEQYAFLIQEIKRTDSLKDVVAYAKTEDLTTLSSSKCVALLTGLTKRPSKNA